MAKIRRPKSRCRTTLDQLESENIPHAGVYVLAYLGKILYVGKAEISVVDRIHTHWYKGSRVGDWLRHMAFDWANVRLDVLEPPDGDERYWLAKTEAALIKRFTPLFNQNML